MGAKVFLPHMSIRTIYTVVFIIVLCHHYKTSHAQQKAKLYPVSYTIKGQYLNFALDHLDRTVVVTDDNQVINFDADGHELFRFVDVRLGALKGLDVTNPLRKLIFFDDYNKIVFLDNTLTEIQRIDLSLTFADINTAAVSNENNIWLIDPVRYQLIKLNQGGEVISQSSNLLDFGIPCHEISKMIERKNILVVCVPNHGFYFFDNFGQFMFQYTYAPVIDFDFDGEHLYILNADHTMATFSLHDRLDRQWDLCPQPGLGAPTALRIQKKDVYILYQEGIFRYSITAQ